MTMGRNTLELMSQAHKSNVIVERLSDRLLTLQDIMVVTSQRDNLELRANRAQSIIFQRQQRRRYRLRQLRVTLRRLKQRHFRGLQSAAQPSL